MPIIRETSLMLFGHVVRTRTTEQEREGYYQGEVVIKVNPKSGVSGKGTLRVDPASGHMSFTNGRGIWTATSAEISTGSNVFGLRKRFSLQPVKSSQK